MVYCLLLLLLLLRLILLIGTLFGISNYIDKMKVFPVKYVSYSCMFQRYMLPQVGEVLGKTARGIRTTFLQVCLITKLEKHFSSLTQISTHRRSICGTNICTRLEDSYRLRFIYIDSVSVCKGSARLVHRLQLHIEFRFLYPKRYFATFSFGTRSVLYNNNNNNNNNNIIIIIINCNWVDTRWQWLFYMYTKYDIGYY
jgi:hypothetical protein